MCTNDKIKTRLLILSDTHNALPGNEGSDVYYRNPLPAADVAIHCGDLTTTGKLTEHRKAIELLRSIRADVRIVIPGNHDLTLDLKYCQEHPRLYGWKRDHKEDDLQSAKSFYSTQMARDAGIHYLEEGTQSFQLSNGAKLNIYASAYTPEFWDWAFAYPRTEDRFNLETAEKPVPCFEGGDAAGNIDVLITHGPPKDTLDMTTKGIPAGCDFLKEAVGRSKPLLHCFGHIHEGWGAVYHRWSSDHGDKDLQVEHRVVSDKDQMMKDMAAYYDGTSIQHGQETLFVNASIMDVHYNSTQAPWIVDLMLNKGKE